MVCGRRDVPGDLHGPTGRFRRVGKSGKEVWIQGSYFPVLDLNGKPTKVVKYASDVTQVKQVETSLEQTAQALASAANEACTWLFASDSADAAWRRKSSMARCVSSIRRAALAGRAR